MAQPILEADSHAKVHMRQNVRGLGKIEPAVLNDRSLGRRRRARRTAVTITTSGSDEESAPEVDTVGDVVLEYDEAVRGILKDDQGGPLHLSPNP